MLDVLAIGAHPDDCEIMMGGTIAVLKNQSYKVGICDLCSGEAGTYGSADIRRQELTRASKILHLDARETLDMPDGNIRNTEENRMKLIEVIRKHRPEIVFSFFNAMPRHPDHYYSGLLAKECVFLAGLEKINTDSPPHRPSTLIHFKELIIKDTPDFIVDISDVWEQKIEAVRAYQSQVIAENGDDSNSKTFIRSNAFWEVLEARSRMAGAMLHVKYGEPFYCETPARIMDIPAAFSQERS
ncbi:MAG: bacillithiol biosynthesis deacetylase BshB1 [bacterium]|nr:bacillithiol biosynthesis deacetylase BshB1 [bacterium]